jgi:hypothetical protein
MIVTSRTTGIVPLPGLVSVSIKLLHGINASPLNRFHNPYITGVRIGLPDGLVDWRLDLLRLGNAPSLIDFQIQNVAASNTTAPLLLLPSPVGPGPGTEREWVGLTGSLGVPLRDDDCSARWIESFLRLTMDTTPIAATFDVFLQLVIAENFVLDGRPRERVPAILPPTPTPTPEPEPTP